MLSMLFKSLGEYPTMEKSRANVARDMRDRNKMGNRIRNENLEAILYLICSNREVLR